MVLNVGEFFEPVDEVNKNIFIHNLIYEKY